MDKGPKLNNPISIKGFRDFYWLKKELQAFCRQEGLQTTRSKLEVAARIKHYISTENKNIKERVFKPVPTSRFDWKR